MITNTAATATSRTRRSCRAAEQRDELASSCVEHGLPRCASLPQAKDAPEAPRRSFEHEWAAISERTKAALQAAKHRGVKLGGPRLAAARKASTKVQGPQRGR